MRKWFAGMMLASTLAFGMAGMTAFAVPSPQGEMLDGDKETEDETDMPGGGAGEDTPEKGNTNGNGNETGYVQDGVAPKTGDINVVAVEFAGVGLLGAACGAAWIVTSKRKRA